MTNQEPEFKKLEKRLVGKSVVVGEYSLEPVVQVTGGYLTAKGETGQGAGVLLRIQPFEVIVSKGDEEPYPVPITNEVGEALKAIAQAGFLVSALCWGVILAVKIFRCFKEKE